MATSKNEVKLAPDIYGSQEGRREIDEFYSATLRALPFPIEERDVQTEEFGKAHVLICGPPDAPPLMLWEGSLAGAPFNLLAAGPLVEKFRVHVVDTPGQSGSRSDRVLLDPDKHAYGRWAHQVCQALGLLRPGVSPPVHIGVSLGGTIVLDLATVAPEAFSAAALFVPGGLHPAYGSRLTMWKTGLLLLVPQVLYRLWPSSFTRRVALGLIFDDPLEQSPMVDQLLLTFKHVKYYPPHKMRFTAEELAGLKAPVYLLAAENDVFGGGAATIACARQLLPSLAVARLAPGARHVGTMKAMEEGMREVADWFEEQVGQKRAGGAAAAAARAEE